MEKWQAGLVYNRYLALLLINSLMKCAYSSVGDVQNPLKVSLASNNAVINVFLSQSLISRNTFSFLIENLIISLHNL